MVATGYRNIGKKECPEMRLRVPVSRARLVFQGSILACSMDFLPNMGLGLNGALDGMKICYFNEIEKCS